MNYDSIVTAIFERFGIKLVGWPEDVPFTNPGKIKPRAKLQELLKAIEDKTCHWEIDEAYNEPAPTKKSKSRKRKAAAGDDDAVGEGVEGREPTKKKKKAAKTKKAAPAAGESSEGASPAT